MFDDILDGVIESRRIEVKNPMLSPYGDTSLMTKTQERVVDFCERYPDEQLYLALIGGKGSGKSHLMTALDIVDAQRYPGSIGCFISNSYAQAKRISSQLIFPLCESVGLRVEFFQNKKVKGKPFDSFYVIDIDGRGFEEGIVSYLLIASFEGVKKLEGIELDYGHVTEIQDAQKDAFSRFVSRIRGTKGTQSLRIDGMPSDEHHWMYRMLPAMGFDEGRFGNFDPETSRGCLFEPAVYENEQNLPENYIDNLRRSNDAEMARLYIEGERINLSSNSVLYNYRGHIHKNGRMSEMLCDYDPSKRLIVSYDFNVSPMCATVWQVKDFSDDWLSEDMTYHADEGVFVGEDGDKWLPGDVSAPDRKVLAQISEYQLWEGGTAGATRQLIKEFAGHSKEVLALGDTTGKNRDTRGEETDWDIIRGLLEAHFTEVTVIEGLEQRVVSGKVRYDNPKKKDQVNVANSVLLDGDMRPSACFMPESHYDSGGVARSVAMIQRKPDGRIDDSVDRVTDRGQYRTHFLDTFMYACYWFAEGTYLMQGVTELQDGRIMRQMQQETERIARRSKKRQSNGLNELF